MYVSAGALILSTSFYCVLAVSLGSIPEPTASRIPSPKGEEHCNRNCSVGRGQLRKAFERGESVSQTKS